MDKKWIKRAVYFGLFLGAFNFLEHFAHLRTDGFSVHRIQFAENGSAPTADVDPETLSILNQPFHYLDCGNQCFVFESEDRKYVLKFFKYARSTVPKFLTQIPLLNTFKPFRPHRYEKVLWKRDRDFRGYQLAYEKFRQETGLVALHLQPASSPTIKISDKLHIEHTLDLSKIPFVLQRKATPIYTQLQAWISSGETEKAQTGIHNLLTLLKKRMYHHLQDDDVHFYSNFGFVETEAIQVDPGHYIVGTSATPQQELRELSQELLTWCEKHAPNLIPTVTHEAESL